MNVLPDISALPRLEETSIEVERRRAENLALQLASIVEYSDDAIISKDLSGIIVSWNRGAERLFGYSAEEAIGMPVLMLIPEGRRDEEPGIIARVRRGERVDPYETVRRHKDGHPIDISLTVSPVRNAEGIVIGASKIARDITERKRSEMLLVQRAEQQVALFEFTDRLYRAQTVRDVHEAALDAICRALLCDRSSILLLDDSGSMNFVAWRGLSERYRSVAQGHSPWTRETLDPQPICIPDLARANLPDDLSAAVRAEGIAALAFIPLMVAGRLIGKFMAYYNTPHAFPQSELDLAVTISRQLGFGLERMQADNDLRRNEKRERENAAEMQAIMEAVPAMIWIARDRDCELITGNSRSRELLRLPVDANASLTAPETERPTHFQILVDGQPLSPDDLPVQRAARGEDVRGFEEEIRFTDGTSRFLIGNATPLLDANGNPRGGVAAFVDITDRRLAEQSLRESELRLQMALDAGKMGAWEWEFGTGRVIWSPGLEKIHGLEPGSFDGTIDAYKRDIHLDDLPRVINTVKETLEAGAPYHVVYRSKAADGSLRWLESFGRVVTGSDGKPERMVGVCMDISERKRADTQRDLLVAELSHRVKNTLATVISIQQQSFSRAASVEEARYSFDARIRALAHTHSQLADGNWEGVSFGTMLRDEFAPYRHEDGGNVRLSGPTLTLNPRCALTLGMGIHELVTNAAKYGALSTKAGTVDVVWTVDARSNQLIIVWSEKNGPPVVPPKRKGFGRLLLERALPFDLKGDVKLEFSSEGVICKIILPLGQNSAS